VNRGEFSKLSKIDIFEKKNPPVIEESNQKKGNVLEKVKFINFQPLEGIEVNNQNSGKSWYM
jgi:hypothetical protein